MYLLQDLHSLKKRYGYVSEKELKKLSIKHNIPISKIYGTVTFYPYLPTEKSTKPVIYVCNSPSCHLNGSFNLLKYLEKQTKYEVKIVSCIGCCDQAPAMKIKDKVYGNLTKKKVKEICKF